MTVALIVAGWSVLSLVLGIGLGKVIRGPKPPPRDMQERAAQATTRPRTTLHGWPYGKRSKW